MIKIQYFNDKKWTTVSEWATEIGWASLGEDTYNYRMIDEDDNILKEGIKF